MVASHLPHTEDSGSQSPFSVAEWGEDWTGMQMWATQTRIIQCVPTVGLPTSRHCRHPSTIFTSTAFLFRVITLSN